MDQETITLTFDKDIETDPTLVYEAFTNTNTLRQWLCNYAQVNAREGGRIYLHWQDGYYAAGEYSELDPEKTVAFTWQGRQQPATTAVHVTLTSQNDHTHLTLTHRGIPADDTIMRDELQQGWEAGLENLKSVLETGVDKRVYERPFLGIFVAGVVTAEQAEALGLPVAGGVRINGAMADTGAAALGLQDGDILVNLGGSEVTDFPSLQAAIRPFKIGEKVKVTYYREGEKQSGMMELGQRPLPSTPSTPADLAAALRDVYDQLDAELDDLLLDLTEEEAAYRPDEDAWHVKDVLAHLIGTERLLQASIAAQITGGVIDTFPNNPRAWSQSITAVYPTLAAITEAWKRAEAETVALVAALPPEFVARKVHYMNVANSVLNGYPGHTRSHFSQIRTAIAAARSAS